MDLSKTSAVTPFGKRLATYEITKRYLGIDQLEKDKDFLETFL